MNDYTTIVIGNGLMGSAAARHLSEWGERVALIGPGEPDDHSQHDGVFSSHYDQGRLAHEHSLDPIWGVVARHAVESYPRLEEQSGISFHGPVGRVLASKPSVEDKAAMQTWMAAVDPTGEKLRYFESADRAWQEWFPFLRFPDDYELFYEAAPAGYINPRELLRAQNVIAQQQGADIIAEQVTDVKATARGVEVITSTGNQFSAEQVLVACGAFTNFNNLLPEPIPLRLKTETMIWAEVSPATATRLQTMPGVGYNIEDPEIDDIYMAPPLLYPDDTYKIKMGCNTTGETWPTTPAEAQAWFQQGNSDGDKPAMERALRSILPDVDFGKITSHRCIVTYTPSGYPTIDRVPSDRHNRLFVATGGNGAGAAGSDTLGKLAAGLVHDGRWLDELPREPFWATNHWGQSEKVLTKAQQRALESTKH